MEHGRGSVSLNVEGVEREELEVDVLLVGAGPSSLACAIQLKRLLDERGLGDASLLVLEKAEDIGYHILSGAVMDPRGMRELFPDWRERGCPVEADVTFDCVDYLKANGKKKRLTGALVPPPLHNEGNSIISLYRVVRWMKDQAEELGVEIYPGFAAASVNYDGNRVTGVQTRDAGIAKDGSQKPQFEPGMNVRAKVTVFAEGTRGSLVKGLIAKLGLDEGVNHQIYETGVKEIWKIPEERGKELLGSVIHTMGQPLGTSGYGGGFIYGISESRLSIGHVVGLDHPDARLDPHALFVEWKKHPAVAELLEGGEMLRYGAKTIPGGGYFAMPKLQGDGFCIVGDSAGFVNMARLKGVHLAIGSGMLAAGAIADALQKDDTSAAGLAGYTERFESSWLRDELWGKRNFRQAFQSGFFMGVLDAAVQQVTGGRGLVGRRRALADHETMQPASRARMTTPSFDDELAFDKLTDVYKSGAIHEEDQPSHLVVTDPDLCVTRCTQEFGNPCRFFCPAAVYEWPHASAEEARDKGGVVINASNCVHCKTCDVKDPYQIIEWTVPEGGGGPKYIDM
ncbi:MAG TPA: electron transfer flavoprotein-ubiquinone oxidoreductase [Planctomycetes bacterium]|nr:electron transfer flavoprotein-ubiquinone oxidoreductase [Planctomycetota bacterium]